MNPLYFKVPLSTFVAIVVADNLAPQIDQLWRWVSALPVWLWGGAPLVVSLVLLAFAKLGWLHKLFGAARRDFQNGHTLESDTKTVEERLAAWKNGANPSLRKADACLAAWGGDLWAGDGLLRCMGVALVYPLVFLWAYWLVTGTGSLGAAQVLPSGLGPLQRWGASASVAALMVWCYLFATFAEAPERMRERWAARPWPMLRVSVWLANVPDQFAGAFAFLGIYAGFLIFTGAVIDAAPDAFAVSGAVKSAVAVALAAAGSGVLTVAFRLAVAASGVLPVAVAGAGVVAGVVGIAVIGAGAFAGTVARASVVAGAVACVVVGVVVLVVAAGRFHAHSRRGATDARYFSVVALAWWALLALVGVATWLVPQLPQWGIPLPPNDLFASSVGFVLLMYFAFAPLLNGLSDWLSVNITRSLLKRYIAKAELGGVTGWQFHAADLGSALALTAALYAAMVGVLSFMQWAGWQISVPEMLRELERNPWVGSSQWLLLMALTNLVPTLYHLALWLAGKAWARKPAIRADLDAALVALKQKRASGGAQWPNQTLCGEGAANLFVYVLKIHPWLERSLVLGLAVFAVTLFTQAVPYAADWALKTLF